MYEGVKNKKKAEQLCDFKGLQWGNLSPTDIDAFIDFKKKGFVFIEAKHVRNTKLERGQELAYERVCDACQAAGVDSLVITAKHAVDEGPFKLADCIVMATRFRGAWKTIKHFTTVKEVVERFRRHIGYAP
jgi:hypothetical protein